MHEQLSVCMTIRPVKPLLQTMQRCRNFQPLHVHAPTSTITHSSESALTLARGRCPSCRHRLATGMPAPTPKLMPDLDYPPALSLAVPCCTLGGKVILHCQVEPHNHHAKACVKLPLSTIATHFLSKSRPMMQVS